MIWDHDELYFGSALDEVEVRSVQTGYQFHFLTNKNNNYKKKIKPYNHRNILSNYATILAKYSLITFDVSGIGKCALIGFH